MKKLMGLMMGALAIFVISGCSSVQVATKLNDQKLTLAGNTDVAHVNGNTWGLYLLSFPLLTGSTEKPDKMVIGEDSVNVSSVVDMVTARSKALGGKDVVDLTSSSSSFWIAPLRTAGSVSAKNGV